MTTPEQLMRNILSDMRVELADGFDKNFERKGFFGQKWPERKNLAARGSLMIVSARLRRGNRGRVRGQGVEFVNSMPYAAIHNEGGLYRESVRQHKRRNKKTGKTHEVSAHTRTMIMPRRRFVGDSPEVRTLIGEVITNNAKRYFTDLAKKIRK